MIPRISAPRRSTRHSDAPPKPPEEEPDELSVFFSFACHTVINCIKNSGVSVGDDGRS